jgi:transposase
VHSSIILKNLLGLNNLPVTIKGAEFRNNNEVYIDVDISKRHRFKCSKCGKNSKYRQTLQNSRSWRALDLGYYKTFIRYSTIRITCKTCGIAVAKVPWARCNSWFTYDFETTVAWLVLHSTYKAISEQMRIDWKSAGAIVNRVFKDLEKDAPNRLDNLVNIGIDETSHRKGFKYITVVVNHDNNTIVWVHNGYGKKIVGKFYDTLTEKQKSSIKYVSADGAHYIASITKEKIPKAKQCLDPFHAVSWIIDAIDKQRKLQWNDFRKLVPKYTKRTKMGRPKKGSEKPSTKAADSIKNARYALGKNPENLTQAQQIKLEQIKRENPTLYECWKLKERFRDTFKFTKVVPARKHLKQWIKDARNSGIELFVELAEKIRKHSEGIMNTIRSNISNARVESMNQKIKVTLRMAYGFRNVNNMISLIMLRFGGIKPNLPGGC